MSFLRLDYSVCGSVADGLADVLLQMGAESVVFANNGPETLLEPDPGKTPLWDRVTVSGWYSLGLDVAAVRGAAERYLGERSVEVVPTATFEADVDWVNHWRLHPVECRFGERLWLLPREAPAPADFHGALLRMDPGLAFGSGSHPTTRLCLQWLAESSLSARRVLDYGAGSGILGIAAALLGASVMAVDHDPQSLLATSDNAHSNAVSARVQVADPQTFAARFALDRSAGPDPRYGVVVANILARPLIELSGRLQDVLQPGGHLVMAGVLVDQAQDVMAAYPQVAFAEPVVFAATDDDVVVEDEFTWVRLAGRKHSTNG